jgi:tRNA(fMet)-specific endonuclease VapC
MWMLDTDTCSYILRAHPPQARARFKRIPPGGIGISSVVLAELFYGADRLPGRTFLREDIRQFAAGIGVLAWDAVAADHYGNIRAELERKGKLIGNMDLLIAAHARSVNAVLVTNNTREFQRVPRLKLENWTMR